MECTAAASTAPRIFAAGHASANVHIGHPVAKSMQSSLVNCSTSNNGVELGKNGFWRIGYLQCRFVNFTMQGSGFYLRGMRSKFIILEVISLNFREEMS